MKYLLIAAALWLTLCFSTNSAAQRGGGPYTLTIFADSGASGPAAITQGSSGHGSNLGHVFVELTNGDKQMYLGYYGDRTNPTRGQLRPDADLAQDGYWDVKKTYEITEQGYSAAHQVIDALGNNVGSWRPWCNCGDFAEAVATVSGVQLEDLPKDAAGFNRPSLWAKYLREHGGTLNPRRQRGNSDLTAVVGTWRANYMQCGFRLSAALKLSNNGGVLSGTLIGQEMKMSNEARGPCDGAEAPDPPTTHSLKSAAFDGHTLTLVIDLYGNDANAQATMSGDKLILQGGENNGIVFTKIQ